MKTTVFLVLGILLLIVTACGTQSVPEATQEFCQSLVAYGESLATLSSISPTSTVGELKDAQEAEQRARQDIEKAARNLKDVKMDSIDDAWKDLDKTVDQVDNQDTLAEVETEIQQAVAGVRAAYDELGLDNCPELFPAAAEGRPGPTQDQSGTPSQPITVTQPFTGTQPVTATEAISATQPAAVPVTVSVASTATAAPPGEAVPAEPSPAAPSSPVGVLWQLQEIQTTSGTSMTPTAPTVYTLMLQPDGIATVFADCIAGTGTYTISGASIGFVMQYTGTMCASPSIASQYINYLDYASSYTMENGALVIAYSNNAGKMTFSTGP